MSSIEAFFAFARERHAIYLRRRASLPAPWTDDPILRQYSFTNVFRELDKTTVWFRENVRQPMMDEPSRHWHELLLATVVFRWFNRIRTGEAIFEVAAGEDDETAWELMLQENNVWPLKQSIIEHCGDGPYVTGAYIIKTPDGYNKLDGVLKCIEWFMEQEHTITTVFPNGTTISSIVSWRDLPVMIGQHSLEGMWSWLRQFPYLGDFMAYEIVTDLRHTPILSGAPDIMTWANPGPGATRGLGRVFHQDKDLYNQHRDKDAILIPAMRILLDASKDAGSWPQLLSEQYINDGVGAWYSDNCDYDKRFQEKGDWPAWEMRDVEHTLCEFDKYERARTGEGRPRGTFRSGS